MPAPRPARGRPGPAKVPLTYLVKQLEQAVRKEMDREMRPLGLTALQYTALSVLERQPGMSAAQLARRSFVSPQAASEMVTALERKGLIERAPQNGSQRVRAVRVTRRGRATLARCARIVSAVEERMVAGLSAAERRTMRTLLCAGVEHLQPAT